MSQTHSILALVGAGLGVALVPQAVERLQPKDVILRPLRRRETVMADLMFAWRVRTDNTACAAVLQAVRKTWPADTERRQSDKGAALVP